MSAMFGFSIDGVAVPARAGQTILEAADAAGVYIPRLCARPDLTPFGSCRLCTVRANGRPQAACTTPAVAGMVVENDVPDLVEHRRAVVEMLFVEGNHYCMFCEKSGDCELQALAYRLGILAPRYPYLFPRRDLDATHPDMLIDRNRCILCARCARASRELDGKAVFGFRCRGPAKTLWVNAASGLGGTDLARADRAAEACPVGCLLPKREGYRVPIGRRRYDHQPIGSDIEASRAPAP